MADNASIIKDRIINILERRGPSLPVHVAKGVNLSMLFASAFLSELFAERRIKISNMKVGNSPLYFLPQHEPMLENFFQFLKNKEKEAFLLLKEKKILKDSELEPAIRVALRDIKDFAIPFKKNEEIYWKYFTFKEEIQEQPKESIKTEEEEKEKSVEKIPKEIKEEDISKEKEKKEIKEKQLITLKEKSKKKPKEKSDFAIEVLKFLDKKDIEILQELEAKKKEFSGIGRINTDIGKVEVLIIGKDKKKITQDDLLLLQQKSLSEGKIILLISNGEIDNKAIDYFNKYRNIIKFLKI